MAAPLLVVGLGNPGPKFSHTRHNVGFDLIEALSVSVACTLRRPWLRPVEWCSPQRSSVRVGLAAPLTYMNRSGAVIPYLLKKSGVSLERMVIAVDNMDLPPGEIRMKRRGGTAGHNGLKSISATIGSDEYPRLYIGVGRPAAQTDTISHVLGAFDSADRIAVDRAIERVVPVLSAAAEYEDIQQLISRVNALRRPDE
ncbi:MAG: aminoacyl-tRNA hydrolase [Alkalispirochaeta sp.]